MTALFASAIVNAAILSMGSTVILWFVLRITPRSTINAATRYGLWWVALSVVVALPLVFLALSRPPTPRLAPLGSLPVQSLRLPPEVLPQLPAGGTRLGVRSEAAAQKSTPVRPQPRTESVWNSFLAVAKSFPLRVRSGLWLKLVLVAWLLATLVLIVRLTASYRKLRQRSSRARDISEPWLEQFGERRFRIALSNEIDTPAAIGLRRPAILIPNSFLGEFEKADLERICVHEAAHLNRRDDMTLFLQRIIEALMPWHPAVMWIARQLDFEREVACDDWVVAVTGDRKDYAFCLTRVAELGAGREAVLASPTVIGNRSGLSRRIDSILSNRDRAVPKFLKLRFLAVTMCFATIVFAGGQVRETVAFREPPQSRSAQIQAIIDDVASAPPELGADILLKLVERGEVTDPKEKHRMIEEAWDFAPRAHYATEFGPNSGVVESDNGSLASSLPGLTTAAIQYRVIVQMASLDAKDTRELFLKMTPPTPDSPSCTASRFPADSSYFKALGIVLNTFSDEETQHGDRTQFMKNSIRSLTSQEDLRLSLNLIQQGKFSEKDHLELIDQWSDALATVRFSDRKFLAMSWLSKYVTREAEEEKANGHSPERLMRALRTYFVRHASAVRCEDGSWRPSSPGPLLPLENNEEVARLMFNSKVSELGLSIPPIQPEDIKPAGFAGKAAVANYLTTDPADKVWQVMNALKHLRFGTPEQRALNEKNRGPDNVAPSLTPEQRNAPEWNTEALRYLTQLEAWTRDFAQEDREVFVMKAEFYGTLLQLTTEGKLHDTVMKSYVNFLVTSPMKRESPPEWAWWGIRMLIDTNIVADKHKWLDEIENAGDTTISLYTRLARLNLDRNPDLPR